MGTVLLLLLALDPSPSLWQSKAEARSLECVRLSQAEAHELYPGEVPELPARGTSTVKDALACKRKIMLDGERPARDEGVLSSLRTTVGEITHAARSLAPAAITWHVDAFYPEAL